MNSTVSRLPHKEFDFLYHTNEKFILKYVFIYKAFVTKTLMCLYRSYKMIFFVLYLVYFDQLIFF